MAGATTTAVFVATKQVASVQGVGFLAGSVLGSSFVIFNDPIYLYIALGGGISSMLGLLHESSKNGIKCESRWMLFFDSLRALFFGFVITPMIFMALMHNGGKLLTTFTGLDLMALSGIVNSFWFLLSLFLSWWTVYFVDKYTKKNRKKSEEVESQDGNS